MPQTKLENPAENVLTVSEVNNSIKDIIESEPSLADVWVKGEISNITKHSSGHFYFTIKDESSQLSCVMFRRSFSASRFEPRQGDRIIVRGCVEVYHPKGSYQLIVSEIRRDGLGDLHRRFLELKDRLEKEGLFDSAHKRPIPFFPAKIGIVTSPTGAVINDIIDTVKRRFPCVQLILAPAVVQGEAAAQSIVSALALLNRMPDIDTIIVARGGGSLEDLWCFNEEKVARAIYCSKIPVIAGIGHETDFTIADFTADLRASTPSIAAERAVPVMQDLIDKLKSYQESIMRSVQDCLDDAGQMLDAYSDSMATAIGRIIEHRKAGLDSLAARLNALDPDAVLKRGYSITLKDGRAVRNSESLKFDDEIVTILCKGKIKSKIKEAG